VSIRSIGSLVVGMGMLALLPAAPASAELAVSQLIVELNQDASRAADIEIYNDSEERSFVSVEPREILDAGLDQERPRLSPDPEQLGLLVSPRRLVIEPRQRRRLRIAAIGPVPGRERVYRVTVKPVSGEVTGSETGLKLLVGYDLLVLVRPPTTKPRLDVVRTGNVLTITNQGDASVELSEGKQCDGNGQGCQVLPSKRLYSGASWRQILPTRTNGEYRVRSADGWSAFKF
jgi:P pilus assembly chaperone PapD